MSSNRCLVREFSLFDPIVRWSWSRIYLETGLTADNRYVNVSKSKRAFQRANDVGELTGLNEIDEQVGIQRVGYRDVELTQKKWYFAQRHGCDVVSWEIANITLREISQNGSEQMDCLPHSLWQYSWWIKVSIWYINRKSLLMINALQISLSSPTLAHINWM